MKKGKKILVGVLSGLFLLGITGFCFMTKDIDEIIAVTVNAVDMNTLQDGEYTGIYEKSRWFSEVRVLVKDGKITDIDLLSSPLIPDVSNELFEKVIEEQKVDVDTVSGATATSKAYLKSIEDAVK
ncbi:uncharacterized protein with FMN-binding domain [Sedimentibacter acidaminivorans]|uniref:Uncharacterized protein with FMN-binding domain n=1 Tax=Sedimentibacter acidaminivorans TaxID=913099 RepID=A0ABS4GAQ9_9FIRM|nr:FMN-binding protein [Sedimentibacter acidaminivorans]MBP1924768.1 uncharacterized protein with FMN-binding domain [Sedimentibacter acidaminivorans]